VICTRPATVPELIGELSPKGTKAVIVITAGRGAVKDIRGTALKEAMVASTKPYLLRICGIEALNRWVAMKTSPGHPNAIVSVDRRAAPSKCDCLGAILATIETNTLPLAAPASPIAALDDLHWVE